MKKTVCFIFAFLSVTFLLFAQKHDNIWIMGYYGSEPHPDLGGIKFDFSQDPVLITDEDTGINFSRTNASICDEDGQFLFVTNGAHVFDASFGIMENGDSLSPFGINFDYYESGMTFHQAALALPAPDNENQYILFHQTIDWNPELSVHFPMLLYSVVDAEHNGGLGAVVKKNELLIEDTLLAGKITASRHGNGRDWWVVTGEEDVFTNGLYSILVEPDSFEVKEKQIVGPGLSYEFGALGQAVFSPDGTKYIRHDVRFDPYSAIDIYDFDRCSGEFTHLEHFELEDITGLGGAAVVSPDSRYLYIITRLKVYQYDLTELDIQATQTVVTEYDGYVAYWFESAFNAGQLGPNGKIYFASASGDTVMHVINTPNHFGSESHVEQHAVALPNLNSWTIPNFPNYRLGPLDGSPCDTLGLDNHPLAGFTFFADELAVTFSDNSYYRPEEWDWDFGDSNGNTERNPIHLYDEPGEYEVCLTVSNENGEDSFCRWVAVDTAIVSGSVVVMAGMEVTISPNPASTQVRIEMGKSLHNPAMLQLSDAAGRKVKNWELGKGQTQGVFWLGDVADGLYFWRLVESGRLLASGKLMVSNMR